MNHAGAVFAWTFAVGSVVGFLSGMLGKGGSAVGDPGGGRSS